MSSSSTISSSLSSSQHDISEQNNIVDHFESMEGTFLGNAELGKDLFAAPDGKDRKNTKYEASAGTPYRFHIYGSLLGLNDGTKISAAGNHVSGEGAYFKPLRDGSVMGRNAKDVHLLVEPAWASPAMRAQFRNSIRVLNAIEDTKESNDYHHNSEKPAGLFSWVKSSDGNEVDQIIVHSPNKYGKPAVGDSALVTAPRRTSKLDVKSATESSIAEQGDTGDEEKKVGKLGAWYEPSVQPDWNNSGFFDLQQDKLRQQNIYNSDGDLVHPQDTYDVLRPGTLMEYICELHIFDIINKYGKNPGLNRYYQIQFIEAHVLLESDEPSCVRPMYGVPHEYTELQRSRSPASASEPMRDFQTYAQKRRSAQRLKTVAREPIVEKSDPQNKRSRNQHMSDKAKGKKKELSRRDDRSDLDDMTVD